MFLRVPLPLLFLAVAASVAAIDVLRKRSSDCARPDSDAKQNSSSRKLAWSNLPAVSEPGSKLRQIPVLSESSFSRKWVMTIAFAPASGARLPCAASLPILDQYRDSGKRKRYMRLACDGTAICIPWKKWLLHLMILSRDSRVVRDVAGAVVDPVLGQTAALGGRREQQRLWRMIWVSMRKDGDLQALLRFFSCAGCGAGFPGFCPRHGWLGSGAWITGWRAR